MIENPRKIADTRILAVPLNNLRNEFIQKHESGASPEDIAREFRLGINFVNRALYSRK